MIDLHCHCLPGLDDGPETMDQAEALLRAAAAAGCEHVVATPHQRLGRWWNCDPHELADLRDALTARLGGAINLHLGAEVRVDDALISDLEMNDRAGLLTLAETNYILLEFARTGLGPDPEEVVHEVRILGLTPILAHPEFIEPLGGNLELLHRLTDMGARVQVTAMSLLERFGRRPRALVEAMLDADLVHFVASDAHDLERRPPGLSAAYENIKARWGETRANRLTRDNALRVLQNRSVEHIPEQHIVRSAPL